MKPLEKMSEWELYQAKAAALKWIRESREHFYNFNGKMYYGTSEVLDLVAEINEAINRHIYKDMRDRD